MAKLTILRPSVATLRSTIAFMPEGERERDRYRDKQPWRRWYHSARWKRLRAAVLLRDLYTCQRPECGRVEPDTSRLVADHRRPHRGDPALFWDADNLQTLCKPCHDGAKQREEVRARR